MSGTLAALGVISRLISLPSSSLCGLYRVLVSRLAGVTEKRAVFAGWGPVPPLRAAAWRRGWLLARGGASSGPAVQVGMARRLLLLLPKKKREAAAAGGGSRMSRRGDAAAAGDDRVLRDVICRNSRAADTELAHAMATAAALWGLSSDAGGVETSWTGAVLSRGVVSSHAPYFKAEKNNLRLSATSDVTAEVPGRIRMERPTVAPAIGRLMSANLFG